MFGPVASKAQFDLVNGFLASAREEGATVATGGGTRSPGFFIEPTVLTDVTPAMRVAREEIKSIHRRPVG